MERTFVTRFLAAVPLSDERLEDDAGRFADHLSTSERTRTWNLGAVSEIDLDRREIAIYYTVEGFSEVDVLAKHGTVLRTLNEFVDTLRHGGEPAPLLFESTNPSNDLVCA